MSMRAREKQTIRDRKREKREEEMLREIKRNKKKRSFKQILRPQKIR